MQQLHDLFTRVLTEGIWEENRTGVKAIGIAGASLEYDCSTYFNLLTTKRVPFKSVIGELAGFSRGVTSAADFRALGCNVWNQNANENQAWLANPFRQGEDDLGQVYGARWRRWPAYKSIKGFGSSPGALSIDNKLEDEGWKIVATNYDTERTIWFKEIDQLANCIRTILNNPTDRRIIFHSWDPAAMDEIALPACHLLYQFIPHMETMTLDLCMTQRSCDLFLGIPYNVASCNALLVLVARMTGYQPGKFVHHMNHVHIYENHLDQVDELLKREHRPLPTLAIAKDVPSIYTHPEADVVAYLDKVKPEDFILSGYDPHPALAAPMAV